MQDRHLGNACSILGSGFVEGFDLAFEADQQRLAFAVDLVAHGHFDPAFADAILFDIKTLLVVEQDADVVLKHRFDVVRAAWVDRQTVGQGGLVGGVGHVVSRTNKLNGVIFQDLWGVLSLN